MLNAGKNKLTVMDQVKSIVSLRALILNGEFLFENLENNTGMSRQQL